MVEKPEYPARVDVSIIIVFYDGVETLRACISSLPNALNGRSHELFIVDNSPGQILQTVSVDYEDPLRILYSSKNVGLARATNSAIDRSSGRYFLCLNPDIVATPGSIDDLIKTGDSNHSAGILAAKLLHPDGSLQYSCRRFYTFGHILVRRTPLKHVLPRDRIDSHHLMKDYDHLSIRDVDWVLGSCMLVRAEAEKEVGPMDSRFFLYFEDVDWCFRMHRYGWQVLYCPDIFMVHHHMRDSASPGFSRQKRNHVASFYRFHMIHGWRVLFRMDRGTYPSKSDLSDDE